MSKEDKNDDYESMSMRELEKVYKERLANKLHSFDTESKEVSLSNMKVETSKDADDGLFSSHRQRYVNDTHFEFQTYGDSDCQTDISDWSPSENFTAAVWHTVSIKSKLLGVANLGWDISAGKGNRVDIRTVGAFGAPQETAACECNSCSSPALGKYSIELKQWSLGFTECDFNLHDVGYDLFSAQVKNLGISYAKFFDDTLYNELAGASPEYSETVGALNGDAEIGGSCCTDSQLMNLYNGLLDVITSMEEADYAPSHIIISPSVARILKGLQSPQPVFHNMCRFGSDGQLASFDGLEVIVTSAANSAAASGVQAIVIDKSRALGASFGKRPFILQERSASCNSIDVYMWCYFNASELDTGAIGHVIAA